MWDKVKIRQNRRNNRQRKEGLNQGLKGLAVTFEAYVTGVHGATSQFCRFG